MNMIYANWKWNVVMPSLQMSANNPIYIQLTFTQLHSLAVECERISAQQIYATISKYVHVQCTHFKGIEDPTKEFKFNIRPYSIRHRPFSFMPFVVWLQFLFGMNPQFDFFHSALSCISSIPISITCSICFRHVDTIG